MNSWDGTIPPCRSVLLITDEYVGKAWYFSLLPSLPTTGVKYDDS